MIESATGAIALDSGESIGSAFTLTAFLASSLAGGAAPPAKAGTPWSYFPLGPRAIGGQAFVVSLGFEGDALRTVDLSMVQAGEATSWEGYSDERELARKARHDAWLEEQLGPLPWWFSWGEVTSSFDPRSGDTSIRIIHYGPESSVPAWRKPHGAQARVVAIVPATGEITLDARERVGPTLTRAAFLAQPLAGGAAPPKHPDDITALPVAFRLPGGSALDARLYFHGEVLRQIVLSMTGDHEPPAADYRRQWANDAALARLVRANELARKARHDAWLGSQLGPPPWSYSWGGISSTYDAAFCQSRVQVVYR
jgi:hypothetical protein